MRYFFCLFSLLVVLYTQAQQHSTSPAIEIRAAWLTTNWRLDWPKTQSVEDQKKELRQILDELQRLKFNVVLFQTRAQGKVFYRSMLEKSSPYFNSSNGFDPLAFAIAECHTRGMECHAWITTFPVENIRRSKKGAILEKRPSFYKTNKNQWFMDPGRPETKDYLVLIAKEITTNYDIDGIHLDYIRYPDDARKFKDQDTYQQYGKGHPKDQWRRDNVTSIVYAIYDTIKAIKPWVQLSSAPIGKYKPLNSYDWTAYEAVHQEAKLWIEDGKHDILFPMLYFEGNDFYPYIDEWNNEKNRPIVPGLAVYKLEETEKNWSASLLEDQLQFIRNKKTDGQAFFRTEQIIKNKKGIKNSIEQFYEYPAKLHPMTWINNTQPHHPQDLRVTKDKDGILNIEWNAPDNTQPYTYNVYWGIKNSLESEDASKLLVANLRDNRYSFPAKVGEYGLFYFVTASDRYHNESESATSVFFVHSTQIH